jgi:hypothetical protein
VTDTLPRRSLRQRLARPFVVFLITLGLVLRLGMGGAHGTIDMDWWKSWIVYAYDNSLISLYGSEDREIIDDYRKGYSFDDLQKRHAREVSYRVTYGDTSKRQRLWVAQPPLYVYSLMVVGGIYKLASGGLEDTRWFNFCVNLLNLISAAVTAALIHRFLRRTSRPDLALPTALAYWLNPLVLLNAPVQGFLDQLCAVWLVASLVMLHEKRVLWAYALFAVSLLMKPTGIVALPVLLVIALKEHGFRQNLKGWALAAAIVLASWAPFILGGHGFSVILGLARLGMQLDVVCRKAINLWYGIQYYLLEGIGEPWFSQVRNRYFAETTGVRADRLGTLMFLAFTALNVGSLWRNLDKNRLAIFSAGGLQVLASYALRTGQHVNHYFLAIPLLSVVALTSRERLVSFAFGCFLFFTADVIFYGFGRDTDSFMSVLAEAEMQSVTVVLAVASLMNLVFAFRAAYPNNELWGFLFSRVRSGPKYLWAAAAALLLLGLGGSYLLVHTQKDPQHAAASFYFDHSRTIPSARGRKFFERVDYRRATAEEIDGNMIIMTPGDPQLEFNLRLKRRACAYIMLIELTPPAQTVLQFFTHPNAEGEFSEDQSRELLLKPGPNEVLIALSRDEVRKRMRLDPGDEPGRYLISHISVRGLRRGCKKIDEALGPKRAVARALLSSADIESESESE